VKPGSVDKWELYRIGKYCDEPVPSGRKDAEGRDVMEPRFTLNCYIQTRDEAVRVVQMLASSFRAMTYWASGAVFVAGDGPGNPSFLFTPSNVRGGEFIYSSTARRARHNAAVVQWNDPDAGYRLEPELFEMGDRIDEIGFRFQLDRVAFGCTSRGQALRDARWALFTENHQTETVAFGTGMEGAQLRPGDVVAVMDPLRTGKRWGGRVRGVDGSRVLLDREVELGAGDYHLIVTTPKGLVAEAIVASPPGATDALSVMPLTGHFGAPAKPGGPIGDAAQEGEEPAGGGGTPGGLWAALDTIEGAVWMLACRETSPSLWRVLSVAMDGEGEYTVTALDYIDEKYAWVERGVEFTDRRAWTGGGSAALPLTPPRELALAEGLYRDGDGLAVYVQAQWSARNADGATYMASYRVDGGNWADLPETAGCVAEIRPVQPPCRLDFAVRARSLGGAVSPPAEVSIEVRGRREPPSDVMGFAAGCDGAALEFRWDRAADRALAYYEIREGAGWDADPFAQGASTAPNVLATGITANGYVTQVGTGARARRFWIKARDTFGNWSANAAGATVDTYGPADRDVLAGARRVALMERMAAIGMERGRLAGLAEAAGMVGAADALDAETARLGEFLAASGALLGPPDAASGWEWGDAASAAHLGEGGGARLADALARVECEASGLAGAVSAAAAEAAAAGAVGAARADWRGDIAEAVLPVQTGIASAKSDLAAAMDALDATAAGLGAANSGLAAAMADIGATRADLAEAQAALAATNSDLASAKSDLAVAQTDLAATNSALAAAQADIGAKLAALDARLTAIATAHVPPDSGLPVV
jgi:flagellin-like hook-associated protein FlgL